MIPLEAEEVWGGSIFARKLEEMKDSLFSLLFHFTKREILYPIILSNFILFLFISLFQNVSFEMFVINGNGENSFYDSCIYISVQFGLGFS